MMIAACCSASAEPDEQTYTEQAYEMSVMGTPEQIKEETASTEGKSDGKEVSPDTVLESIPLVVSEEDWQVYSNVYRSGDISKLNYEIKEGTGIFTTIKNNKTGKNSYYVWGYSDEDRTHDWQWELDLENYNGQIPSNGSLIHYSGTFVSSELANDYYWLTNVYLDVKRELVLKTKYDYDTRTMSPTLSYFQLCHVLGYIGQTEGQPICIYGRVSSLNMDGIHTSVQHPYIDDFWNITIDTQINVPKIGSTIVIKGTVGADMMIHNATVKPSSYQFNANENKDMNITIHGITIPLPTSHSYSENGEISTITFNSPYAATINYKMSNVPVGVPQSELENRLTDGWLGCELDMQVDMYKEDLSFSNMVVRRKTDTCYELRAYQDIGESTYLYIEITHDQNPYSFQEVYGCAEILIIDRLNILKTKTSLLG